MKKEILLFIGLLLAFSIVDCTRDEASGIDKGDNTVTVYSSPELYRVTSEWAARFSASNPGINLKVISTPATAVSDQMVRSTDMGFVTGETGGLTGEENVWKLVVGRDVVLPIFSAENPFYEKIVEQGISAEKLSAFFSAPEMRNWGTLLGTDDQTPARVYMVEDPLISQGMARLMGLESFDPDGIKSRDEEELVTLMRDDPYSLGLGKMAGLAGSGGRAFTGGIALVPIDRNGNGKIDHMENIYEDMEVLSRGVMIGKYPRALTTGIYSLFPEQPGGNAKTAFLKWVLTDGQQYLSQNGFVDLADNERLAKVTLLEDFDAGFATNQVNYASARQPLSFYIYFPIFLTAGILLIFFAGPAVEFLRKRRAGTGERVKEPRRAFNVELVTSPHGLYYDRSHTWAFMEQEGIVRIGIDDFLQHITGPITRIKTLAPGEKVKKGKKVISIIQQGKQLDICAPVSGTIKEINGQLSSGTSILNSSPYAEGWIYRIEPDNWFKEIQFLITGKKYREWLKSEFSRLKEFLTTYIQPEKVEYAYVLQDGGELKDGILADLGPEAWEEFQRNFIDTAS